MELLLENKDFFIYTDFETRISKLKKSKKIEIGFTVWDVDFKFISSLKEIKNPIVITNANKYFWLFDRCKLVKISQERSFELHSTKYIHIKLVFSFEDVNGSNNLDSLKRDLILTKLLED